MAESETKQQRTKALGKSTAEGQGAGSGQTEPPEPVVETTTEPTSPSEQPVKTNNEEPVFSHDNLIRRAARTVGFPSHVVSGALAGVEQEYLTIEETRALCEKWVKGGKE